MTVINKNSTRRAMLRLQINRILGIEEMPTRLRVFLARIARAQSSRIAPLRVRNSRIRACVEKQRGWQGHEVVYRQHRCSAIYGPE